MSQRGAVPGAEIEEKLYFPVCCAEIMFGMLRSHGRDVTQLPGVDKSFFVIHLRVSFRHSVCVWGNWRSVLLWNGVSQGHRWFRWKGSHLLVRGKHTLG